MQTIQQIPLRERLSLFPKSKKDEESRFLLFFIHLFYISYPDNPTVLSLKAI